MANVVIRAIKGDLLLLPWQCSWVGQNESVTNSWYSEWVSGVQFVTMPPDIPYSLPNTDYSIPHISYRYPRPCRLDSADRPVMRLIASSTASRARSSHFSPEFMQS